mmetsp:Transcript_24714/g.45702  ORF Transcript_24714/g.45702 Transcript_24714/m.45702 type:complete len:194 (+) Transcript_24714:372-953(+)
MPELTIHTNSTKKLFPMTTENNPPGSVLRPASGSIWDCALGSVLGCALDFALGSSPGHAHREPKSSGLGRGRADKLLCCQALHDQRTFFHESFPRRRVAGGAPQSWLGGSGIAAHAALGMYQSLHRGHEAHPDGLKGHGNRIVRLASRAQIDVAWMTMLVPKVPNLSQAPRLCLSLILLQIGSADSSRLGSAA